MTVKTFYCNPFRECTYILSDEQGNGVIIDAGCYNTSEQQRLAAYIASQQLAIRGHLLTHAHLDHLLGARFVFNTYGILPTLSAQDNYLFDRQQEQAAAFGCPLQEQPLTEFIPISDGNSVQFGTLSFQAIATPGHTLGGICYYMQDAQPHPILFSGDTLFAGSIGRCDLPGGNQSALLHSIQTKLLTLPEDTTIYPGHGFETTIGTEKRENPYL